jgi:hypothetical protein
LMEETGLLKETLWFWFPLMKRCTWYNI